jgi:hypothetical protein
VHASHRLSTLKLTADLHRGVSMELQDEAAEVCAASRALRAEAEQARLKTRELRARMRASRQARPPSA